MPFGIISPWFSFVFTVKFSKRSKAMLVQYFSLKKLKHL